MPCGLSHACVFLCVTFSSAVRDLTDRWGVHHSFLLKAIKAVICILTRSKQPNKTMTYSLLNSARFGCLRKHDVQRTAAVHPSSRSHVQQQCRSRRRLRVAALGFDFGDGERDSRLAAEPPRPSPKAFSAYTLVSACCCVQHSTHR